MAYNGRGDDFEGHRMQDLSPNPQVCAYGFAYFFFEKKIPALLSLSLTDNLEAIP